MTITGTSLPLAEDIESVTMSKTDCFVNSSSEIEIVCTLENNLVHGDWVPEIRTVSGLSVVAPTVVPVSITGSIESVSPSLELNKAGGQVLLITGTHFPNSLDTEHKIELVFTTGNSCKMITIKSTEIMCETEPFETSTNRRRMLESTALRLSFNGNQVDEFTGISLAETDVTVDSINPSTASPILVQTLVVQLSSTYDNVGMNEDTFTVSIHPQNKDGNYGSISERGKDPTKYLNVID